MPILTRRLFLTSGVLGVGGLAAACSSTPESQIYTLVSEPSGVVEAGPKTLSIVRASIPAYLDRPQIVRYDGVNKFLVNEFERWGEPLQDMITRVMISNLTQRLPRTEIFPTDGAATVRADVEMELDILRFEAGPDGIVRLDARWLLMPRDGEEVLGTAHLAVTPADRTTGGLVAAMSDALAQLSDALLPDVAMA